MKTQHAKKTEDKRIDEKAQKSRASHEEAKKAGRDVIKRHRNVLNELAKR